jgi:molybdopterin-guanine dinucleotide biosynthesis protein A
MQPLTGIILAGGEGHRVGGDKANLMLRGKSLIDWVATCVRQVSDDLVIVVRRPEARFTGIEARLTVDRVSRAGSLAGVHAGLLEARYPWSLVVGCDMPFLNQNLLRYLISQTGDYDVVIPCIRGLLEPLHALYHKRCLPAIEDGLARGCLKITSFLADVRVRYVGEDEIDPFDPQHLSFFNINTLADWVLAQELLSEDRA